MSHIVNVKTFVFVLNLKMLSKLLNNPNNLAKYNEFSSALENLLGGKVKFCLMLFSV